MHNIQGTFCAALTPINENYSINKVLFLKHCKNILTQGLDGLAIFGTTGEANSFSVNEKIEAINYLIENNIDPQKILPGTGLCSIQDTVLLSKHVTKLNVKAMLILPAFYYKNVSDNGVIDYYKKVVEEVGDNSAKYLLYNIPKISGVKVNINVIEKLIHLFPKNIVGMKDSDGDLSNMLKVIKSLDNFSLFSGSDSLALEVCKQGGAGAITAAANISGSLLSYIINNYKQETNIKNFYSFQDLLVQIRNTLFSHEPISALKAFLSVNEQDNAWNRILPPLNTISDPHNDKTVIALMELIKKMKEMLSNT